MHIALIGMSGVRAHDLELTELGTSLPGFADRARTIASLPSLSLLTIAALTPDRHEVTHYEIDDIGEPGELPGCDLAAISTFTAKSKDAYLLAERFRRAGVSTVIGGLNVTAEPEEALEHCDAVVVGEGEVSWPRVSRTPSLASSPPRWPPSAGSFPGWAPALVGLLLGQDL